MARIKEALRSTDFWRKLNIWLTALWVVMVPVAIFTGWIESLIFISGASIYANAASHLAAWRADEDMYEERFDKIEEMLKEIKDG
jgi:hypothetical protein